MALKEIPLEKAFGEGDSGYVPKYEKARIGMSLDECEPMGFLGYHHYNDELNFD